MKKSRRRVSIFLCFPSVALLALMLGHSAFRSDAAKPVGVTGEPALKLSGEAAREYLTQNGDGRALMEAVTAARFGLRWQEHGPAEKEKGDGYLGLSHDQNLNAWFDGDGVTVRPMLPEAKREQGWSMALRLKSYGYGKQLVDAPPVTSREVKGNRVEYLRPDQAHGSDYSNLKSRIENRKLIEWYENRAEGIEQGFTLNERPPSCSDGALSPSLPPKGVPTGRSGYSADGFAAGESPEALRVLLTVTGDLRAQPQPGGDIELTDANGKGVVSYSKLVAVDVDGKKLGTRMEASADGREIALIVEDAGARYPIVIDPIVASLEKKLDGYTPHAEARFGFAVAVDNDRAVVGAWRDNSDTGIAYFFSRSGSTWSRSYEISGGANWQCGTSVAIDGGRAVFGCPGANSVAGTALIYDLNTGNSAQALTPPAGTLKAADRFGASVAIRGNKVVVGAPLDDNQSATDNGAVYLFVVDSNLNYSPPQKIIDNLAGRLNGYQLGTSVATDGNTIIAGAPGPDSGTGKVVVFTGDYTSVSAFFFASDGAAGDNFGQSVAISGNTAVVGAQSNDNARGTNAGAAYVFVQDGSGNWSQQQKLTASDGGPNNYFSSYAVAIEGNTIVVGAYGWTPPPNGAAGSGKAYVFMRNGTVWTQQTTIRGDNATGTDFGMGVDISGNSVIVGARAATAAGVIRAGAAYVYRLDCVPPWNSQATLVFGSTADCPGSRVVIFVSHTGSATGYQWRKNGTDIPGATESGYVIPSASSTDTGVYDVIVRNSCGSDISNSRTLTIQSLSINPTSQNFSVSGSTGIVNVTSTGSKCTWTAVSNDSFITVNSGSSGTGNGTVGFTVAANPNSKQRTGTITIAGKTFSVSQDGTNCSYSIAPTSQNLTPAASTKSVNVTTSAGCAWTATSNDPSFLSINSGASGTGNGTVTYTIAANSTAAPRTGTLTIAGQTFTVTQAAPGLVGNVSTRLPVGTGDNALFEGFIVQGPAGSTKKIIVRAIGPALIPFGIPDALANPTLELHDSSTATIAVNNDWKSTQSGGLITANQVAEISGSGFAPSNDLESAIIANLVPGSYTAVVRGVGNATGTGVVDAYDLSGSSVAKLTNVATRGLIQPGDKLMIAGLTIQNGPVRLVVRAIGPSLLAFGINNALPDTTLELRDSNAAIVRENDNWRTDQQQELINAGLQPSDDLEAALVATIPPGQYTAQVRGKNEATGIGVVQVYFLQ